MNPGSSSSSSIVTGSSPSVTTPAPQNSNSRADPSTYRKHKGLIIGLPVAAASLILFLAIFVLWRRHRRRPHLSSLHQNIPVLLEKSKGKQNPGSDVKRVQDPPSSRLFKRSSAGSGPKQTAIPAIGREDMAIHPVEVDPTPPYSEGNYGRHYRFAKKHPSNGE